ncbi:MAG TPA: cysteine--tRNA ligase [Polyangiaceae bacterium]|nr:cysteine--tRNA ligase [Polyangiaceae bacterium]
MPPRFYNTLTRTTEELVTLHPAEARVYLCGVTPYDHAHTGNARSAVVFDVLVRHLRARGYKVVYVRNITDVDDKILDRAQQSGEEPLTLSARMAAIYQADMGELGCAPPTHEPKVSEYIPEIIELVQKIIANGNAYEAVMPSGAHDVYFAVRSFAGYGKLSRRKLDELEAGARVSRDDENKRDPLDFALWKGCTEASWGWPSPWGKGRPGWHIECSAMSSKLLGHGFDIHAGGMDLIFPHHENEIAQNEAACPGCGPVVRVWMHNGFLNMNKEKMSKSLGNIVKPRDVYRRNDPEALRYSLLTAHYRGPLSFDIDKTDDGEPVFPGVDEAERRVDYLYGTLERLAPYTEAGETDPKMKDLAALRPTIADAQGKILAALDDDLNTPVALAELGELAKAANDLCDLLSKRKKDATLVREGSKLARAAREALVATTGILGLLGTPSHAYRERTRARRLAARRLSTDAIEEKLRQRTEARQNKDFARADQLRAELIALGVDVADSPEGSTWNIRA